MKKGKYAIFRIQKDGFRWAEPMIV
jgi:hypothetical protein